MQTTSDMENILIDLYKIILSESEIQTLTGYKKPKFQLEELKRMGFFRARQNRRTGHIILERVHYEAVSSGITLSQKPKKEFINHKIR
jgi:hypothetical protein